MLKPVPFYFLRHGETDWNLRGVMQGQTDIPLNSQGEIQAAAVAPKVAALPVVTVCCSPLQRARRTAEITNAGLNRPTILIDDLMECCFGAFEGKPSGGPWHEVWRAGAAVPGGETIDDFIVRVCRGLNQALSYPGPVLVVGHGGAFWAIERYALEGRPVRVSNCSLFSLQPPLSQGLPWTCDLLANPDGAALAIGESASA